MCCSRSSPTVHCESERGSGYRVGVRLCGCVVLVFVYWRTVLPIPPHLTFTLSSTHINSQFVTPQPIRENRLEEKHNHTNTHTQTILTFAMRETLGTMGIPGRRDIVFVSS